MLSRLIALLTKIALQNRPLTIEVHYGGGGVNNFDWFVKVKNMSAEELHLGQQNSQKKPAA